MVLFQGVNRMDLSDINLVYCFQKDTMEAALNAWIQQQIAAFPDKENDILIAAASMRDFMNSEHVVDHGMVVKQLLNHALSEQAS